MSELVNVELSDLIEILSFINKGKKDSKIIWWTEDNKLMLGIKESEVIYIIPNKVINTCTKVLE